MYDTKKLWEAYLLQRRRARQRKVEWAISFQEWSKIWIESGHWQQRGNRRGCYQMCRTGDVGPYSADNVRIDTIQNNICENKNRRVEIDGVVYPSVSIAAQQLGLKRSTLTMRITRGMVIATSV